MLCHHCRGLLSCFRPASQPIEVYGDFQSQDEDLDEANNLGHARNLRVEWDIDLPRSPYDGEETALDKV